MQIETFSEHHPRTADASEVIAHEYHCAGLKALDVQVRQVIRQGVWGHLLGAEELAVWTWRYPTRYSTTNEFERVEGTQCVVPWKQLLWPVPSEVRQIIPTTIPAFDSLEIWTPELRRAPRIGPSPILVGRRGSAVFLIARWAEVLEPYEDIRTRMLHRHGRRAITIRTFYLGGEDLLGGRAYFWGILGLFPTVTFVAFGVLPAWLTTGTLSLSLFAMAAWRRYLRTPRAVRWACTYAGWVLPELP